MFERNVELSQHSNYKIGGKAEYFTYVEKVQDLLQAVEEAKKLKLPIFILGGGTNLLIHDNGIKGLVIKTGFKNLEILENTVKAGGGVLMLELLDFYIQNELSGLEWAGGLPGTLGGAIFGNAGAFGGEIKDSVLEVSSVDISSASPQIIKRSKEECNFSYRSSIFKERALQGIQELIVEAKLELQKGDREEISKAIEEKIKFRQDRHPVEYPNIGSIFKNIPWESLPEKVQERFLAKKKIDPMPVLPIAVLIDAAGLKGLRIGDAQVSEKHPNFIINLGKASSEDVRKLSEKVRELLKEEFSVEIEREVIFL